MLLEPAVPAGVDMRRRAYEIASLRDRVLSTGTPADSGAIRSVIGADWELMCRQRVRPDGADSTFIDERELADLRHRPDLALAWQVLCAHALNLGNPDYMVVLADERGRVLRRDGNHTLLSRSDSGGFCDGADMVTRGTNGLRLAVVAHQPVQLYGPEHWLTSEARFTCTAVPIRDPDFGRTVAVINTTAPWHTVHGHTLLMLAQIGRIIENALAAGRNRAQWGRLRAAVGPLSRLNRPALLVDREGVVVDAHEWEPWLPGHVVPDLGQVEPGRTCLRAIGWCDLEPLPNGWLITHPGTNGATSVRATLDLTRPGSARLIVRGPNVFWPVLELRPLHARIVRLIHERGRVTTDELTVLLHRPTQVAPEMSKLRRELGGLLAPHRRGEPHRFADQVVVDVASGL